MRRLIFTLLYDRGQFMLSRNFRLQAVGTIDWLFDNYDFARVSRGLDELMVLDVSRGVRDPGRFAEAVQYVAGLCFIPVTVGGGVTSFDIAQRYMRSGADKLLINSAFHSDPALCRSLAGHFGRQCIVAGVDYRRTPQNARCVMTEHGSKEVPMTLSEWVNALQKNGAGEILFQSIDQDGTGMGLDLSVVDQLREPPEVPCILMGGVGKAGHIIDGLRHPTVDAVATANLFNFIGSTFLDVRRMISATGIEMAHWVDDDYALLRQRFAGGAGFSASAEMTPVQG
jgi:imidazole glycerol-phosphate synthase subunit HisF